MVQKKIVTGADRNYFYALITLLSTLYHRGNLNDVSVDIWDLGLTKKQKVLLTLCLRENWNILDIESLGSPPFPTAFDPSAQNFAWKPKIIQESLRGSNTLLWLDAGVCIANDINKLFELIDKQSTFFVKNNEFQNKDYISSECKALLSPSPSELDSFQIHANVLGFTNENESVSLLNEWVLICSEPNAVLSLDSNHRHDQTVLSILIARRNFPLSENKNFVLESDNYERAVKKSTLFLAHRRKFSWIDFNSLINSEYLK